MADTEPQSGRRIVGWIFTTAITIAIGFGYFIGLVIRNDASVPISLFTLQFRPTPFNMAAYGGIAVALLLTIGFGLMTVASRREDRG